MKGNQLTSYQNLHRLLELMGVHPSRIKETVKFVRNAALPVTKEKSTAVKTVAS